MTPHTAGGILLDLAHFGYGNSQTYSGTALRAVPQPLWGNCGHEISLMPHADVGRLKHIRNSPLAYGQK